MKIPVVFDNIIFSLQKTGGISVVWFELINRIFKDEEVEISFWEYHGAIANIFRKKINLTRNVVYLKSSFNMSLKRYINPVVKKDGKFIFHSSYYRICRNKNAINITTVHDFTYEYFFGGVKRMVHSWQKARAIKRADYIICISENTKKDIVRFFPFVDESKIRVIYNGVSSDFCVLDRKWLINDLPYEKYSYILFVGSRAAYKNFALCVETVAKTSFNFVIVGNELTKGEILLLDTKLGKHRYQYVGRVSNKELNTLYNYAFCFLYPSSYEGFGIPILEAQNAGCPVIAYNNSSIPEVIGETPLLINSLEISEILSCLQLLENLENREQIICKGCENAERFSWNKMYRQVLDLYIEAFNTIK